MSQRKRQTSSVLVNTRNNPNCCSLCNEVFANLPRHRLEVHGLNEDDIVSNIKLRCSCHGKKFDTQKQINDHLFYENRKQNAEEKTCEKCRVKYKGKHNVCIQKRVLKDKIPEKYVNQLREKVSSYRQKEGIKPVNVKQYCLNKFVCLLV